MSRLDELCATVDVLVIAAPITPNSRGLIGAGAARAVEARARVVLSCRAAAIVDEPALVDALEEGHLPAAGLDVTATEPLPAATRCGRRRT